MERGLGFFCLFVFCFVVSLSHLAKQEYDVDAKKLVQIQTALMKNSARLRKVTVPRTHSDSAIQLWIQHFKKDIDTGVLYMESISG